MMTYPVLSLVDVLGETFTDIVDIPELPDVGETSIQLFDVATVQFASELIVISALLAVLLNNNVSVDALMDAGACLTVIVLEVFVLPS